MVPKLRRAAYLVGAGTALVIAILILVIKAPWEDDAVPRPELPGVGRSAELPDARSLALKPGKDRWLVESSCTTCHSMAPIIRHDGFTPKVWEQEVHKMIDRYGAPIPDRFARRIIAYLQTNYASPPRPAAGTTDAPGTG